ncbi:MAG: hypothetical protein FJ000_02290 [Actinobacteria bacterium]|nr:hypothetical protein [Actinomycetota bacterium]
MLIGPERDPHLQIDDGVPFPVERCEVVRQVDHSLLTAVVHGQEAYRFPVGARVTLWAGGSVLFVGRAMTHDRVLDLMSTEADGELRGDETI